MSGHYPESATVAHRGFATPSGEPLTEQEEEKIVAQQSPTAGLPSIDVPRF